MDLSRLDHSEGRMAMAESPATALRRYQTDLRKLIRGGFNRYADCKKCWVVWTDDGRDALTDAANAAIVGDVGASRPMPHRLAALPGAGSSAADTAKGDDGEAAEGSQVSAQA
jgi:hypothetical protein